MSDSRLENSVKNSIMAIFLKIVQIAFPFICRTIVMKMLGFSYVGVSGLFVSIFGFLGIAELGVGSAMLHALYEPIEKKDANQINAIINFYKKAYTIVGLVILIIGIILTPCLKFLIKPGTYPEELNIYYIYFISLVSTVSSYLIYSYKSLILEAHQMGRMVAKIRIWMAVVLYIVQILILLSTKNYYLYVLVEPVVIIIIAILVARTADKMYPQYKPKGKLEENVKNYITKDIKALFLYKIGGVVNNYVDGIIISWWFGAVILGIYNNYYYIISSISMMILVIYNAILPSVGNSIVNCSKKTSFKNFLYLSFFDSWAVGWSAICLCCILEPFITLWAGRDGALGVKYAFLFALYFYVWRFPDALSIYKDAAGLWDRDKWRPLATAILNLILNIVLIQIIGLYGVLLSTILATLLINFPISVKYVMDYFEEDCGKYLRQQFFAFVITVVNAILTYSICSIFNKFELILNILMRIFVCLFLSNGLYIWIYRKNEMFLRIKKSVLIKLAEIRKK